MSLRFFTRTRAGELQSRIANDVGGVDNIVTNTASSTVQNVIAALAVVVAALVMEWRLALVCLIVVPIFLIFSMRLGRTAPHDRPRAADANWPASRRWSRSRCRSPACCSPRRSAARAPCRRDSPTSRRSCPTPR